MKKPDSDLKRVSRSVISDMFRIVLRLQRENGFKGSEIFLIMANVWRGSGNADFEAFLLETAQARRRYEKTSR
jgi:hypothetical protein